MCSSRFITGRLWMMIQKSDGEVELTYDYLPAGYYFYSFELHDIYGNVYYTPYITQEIDEEGNIWFYPEDMEDT